MTNRVQGNFPITSEVNPIQQCKVITVRSESKDEGFSIEEKAEIVKQKEEKGEK